MRNRGFTVVEILIVIIVLVILVTMTGVAFTRYLSDSEDTIRKSIAANVLAAAERYYTKNNEYPSASLLYDGTSTTTPNGSRPSSYQSAATNLDITINSFSGSQAEFVPCVPSVSACTPSSSSDAGKRKSYYITKNSTASQSITFGGCTYTFPALATTDPILVDVPFIVTYWSSQDGYWVVAKSAKGSVQTSDTTSCPFRTL